mgnify:FL=1
MQNICSECEGVFVMSPYHTEDKQQVFCGAQCSLDWHIKKALSLLTTKYQKTLKALDDKPDEIEASKKEVN